MADIPAALRSTAQQTLNIPALAGIDLGKQPGIICDLLKFTLPMTYSNGNTAVTVGNVLSTTATVTTVAGGNTLLITGSQPASQALHQGHPCSIALGNGVVWSGGRILDVLNSGANQIIVVDGPGAPATVTAVSGQALSIGVTLTTADQGKMFWAEGTFSRLHGALLGTIGTVTGRNTFTLSVAASNGDAASGSVMRIAYGTDNYAALVTAFGVAVQSGIRVAHVTGPMMASKYPVSVGRVVLRGEFPLFVPTPTAGPYVPVDTSPASYVLKPVVSELAPDPEPPETTLRGEDLFAQAAGRANPVVGFVGASTFTADPGEAGMQSSPVRLIRDRMQARNIGRKKFVFVELAEGGQTILQYAGLQARGGGSAWDANGATPWVGQPSTPGYLYNAAPNVVFLESSANDTIGVQYMQAIVHLHAMLNSWAAPPSVTWVTNANKDIADTNIFHSWFDHNTKWLDGWCKVNGYGHVSMRREYTKARDGQDPCLDYMMYQPPNATTIANGTNILTGAATKAFCAGFIFSGTPSAFWAAVGNQIGFTIGDCNDATIGFAPLFRIGYDPNGAFPGGHADQIYYQVDLAFSLPGLGLPGTCQPTVLGGFAMTAGSNLLTYSAADGGPASIFLSGDGGGILTVPGAGDSSTTQSVIGACGYVTTPWQGAQPAPLVGYMQYVSGTQVRLFQDAGLTTPLNAVTAISAATPQCVMRGSPRVYPGISGIASDGRTGTTFRVWSVDDEVGFWWQGRDDQAVRSVAVKPSMVTTPLMVCAGSGLSGRLAINFATGNLYDLWIGDVVTCKQTGTDDEFLGSGAGGQAVEVGGTQYSAYGPFGGGSENHPASRINRLWQRVLNAVDFRAP